MRPTLLFLLAIAGAPASDGAAADPAVALPREFRFVAEAEDVAGLTVRLRATPIFADLPLPTEANPVLDALATAGVRRAAFAAGFAPHRGWVLAASADDRDACAEAFAVVAERLGGGATAVRIGPFAGLCDGPETVERLRKLPLTGRDAAPPPGVIAARTRCAGADVRFHLDLSGTRLFRLGVARLHDAGHALLAAHVASVAASADAAWGRLDAGSRTALTLEASVPPLPEARRFAAPDAPAASRPSASTLELPPGWLARLSLTRDLAAFWERRDVFVPDSGRAALAEFRNNLSTLLGGLAPEDLFAGLGTGFDLF
ncbi:MAG TPA: hypothetical protein VEI02_03990, partial [Planctomycetota bacterium]|nr:hypothetical protein [Planctomycetota bacterium]